MYCRLPLRKSEKILFRYLSDSWSLYDRYVFTCHRSNQITQSASPTPHISGNLKTWELLMFPPREHHGMCYPHCYLFDTLPGRLGTIPTKLHFHLEIYLINCLRINANSFRVYLDSACGHYKFNPLISHIRNIPDFVHHSPSSNFWNLKIQQINVHPI